jgi:DNA-damage-inducible protein J
MTKAYSLRLDEDTRNGAKKVFDNLGMDFSTGVKIYLRQVIKTNGIPFELSNNVSSLDRSLNEYRQGNYKSFNSVDELFKDLDSDKDGSNDN